MEFNELKVNRNAQNQEPPYAMNVPAWHAEVQRRSQEWNCRSGRCIAREITVGVICGGLVLAGTGVLSFGDLAWVWLGTLPWAEVAVLTARAIAKWRTLGIAISRLGSPAPGHLKNLTNKEQRYGV